MSDRNASAPQSTLDSSPLPRAAARCCNTERRLASAWPASAPSRRRCAATANQLGAANLRRQGELAAEQVVRLPKASRCASTRVSLGGRGLEPLQNLFEGLVFIDQRDGLLQMGVAEKMDVNDEQTEFTFTCATA